jgi:hypothetical protein
LVGVIVKSNDDLLQETFVMQLVELCQESGSLRHCWSRVVGEPLPGTSHI